MPSRRRRFSRLPAAWIIQPQERRIAAVAEGYREQRTPTSEERDLLLDAMRFGIAFVGVLHLAQALLQGERGESMDIRLGRIRNRLEVSADIAAFATRHLR